KQSAPTTRTWVSATRTICIYFDYLLIHLICHGSNFYHVHKRKGSDQCKFLGRDVALVSSCCRGAYHAVYSWKSGSRQRLKIDPDILKHHEEKRLSYIH